MICFLCRILSVEHGNESILMTEIWIENQPKNNILLKFKH